MQVHHNGSYRQKHRQAEGDPEHQTESDRDEKAQEYSDQWNSPKLERFGRDNFQGIGVDFFAFTDLFVDILQIGSDFFYFLLSLLFVNLLMVKERVNVSNEPEFI